MAILAQADATAGGRRAGGARPPLGKIRRTVREIGLAMVTGGVVVLAFATYQLFGTTLAEQQAQTRLQHSFAAALAQSAKTTSPSPTTTPSGSRGSGASGTSGASKTSGAPGKSGGSRGSGGRRHRYTSGGGAASGDKPTVGSAGSLSPSAPPGTALDHLVIPKIGVNKYVVQGTAPNDLAEGPGHYIGTPLPGQRGNAAIAGHRTTYGAPFYRLNNLSIGDRIYLTATSGRIYVYRVAATKVVSPSDITVLDPTKNAVLTLTTCNPPFSATSRLVVVADLVQPLAPAATPATTVPATTVPATTTPAATTPATGPGSTATPAGTTPAATTPATTALAATTADNLGSGNNNGWPPALAYGVAFVVLWIGTRLAINRTRRWARLGAVVIGILVCAVPLWFCFENVVRLLPANI